MKKFLATLFLILIFLSQLFSQETATGLHNDYHQTTDTVEKCFPEGIAQICKFVFNIAWILTEKEQRWEFTEVN